MRPEAPNAAHAALAELERQGRFTVLVTQNVDGLHQASGVPASKVIELHGNTTYAKCLDCGERMELEAVRQCFVVEDRLPVCISCGGIVKTATISFGQAMPEDEMRRAQAETLARELPRVAEANQGITAFHQQRKQAIASTTN